MTKKNYWVLSGAVCFLTLIAAGFFLFPTESQHSRKISAATQQIVTEEDFYTHRIQPIFNNRCIACHSCLESPCQVNLQSFEGLERGGIRGVQVYDGARGKEITPTRLYEDATTTAGWRRRGFHDILGDQKFSILMSSVDLGFADRLRPKDGVQDKQYCMKSESDFDSKKDDPKKFGMPYGLPSIAAEDRSTLQQWIAMGAPGPIAKAPVPPAIKPQVRDWENFFNAKDLKSRIVSRYLYEHLFLAHLFFKESPNFVFKLIRSSTACESAVTPIATRRPNEDPGVKEWFYCLAHDQSTVVDKTHMPYEIGPTKMKWLKDNFYSTDWKATEYPSFNLKVSANPFIAFKEIPIHARYQFLLRDAQYHIMTFIKGPVCNGTAAVNVIQDQFYVFFVDPHSNLMTIQKKFSESGYEQLTLPGTLGSRPSDTNLVFEAQAEVRNAYRRYKNSEVEKLMPNGLTLNDIWDGEGSNNNALLTVFRNDDNARVVKGAVGDIPMTAFVLDYSLFERLVYNLVVNFDIYGNIGHQYLTRMYMDLIRMEAENNFLEFLPPERRWPIKKHWYRGSLTGIFTSGKLRLLGEKDFAKIPAGINYRTDDQQLELVQKIIFERLNENVRGKTDSINWKKLLNVQNKTEVQKQLSQLASIQGKFPRYFPEISFLVMTRNGAPIETYSILKNRGHKNISWILAEGTRTIPEEDTLTITKGLLTSYPNQFFVVEENALSTFTASALQLKKESDYHKFLGQYGVDRLDKKMWMYYDFINQDYKQLDPVGAGFIDLSRYAL